MSLGSLTRGRANSTPGTPVSSPGTPPLLHSVGNYVPPHSPGPILQSHTFAAISGHSESDSSSLNSLELDGRASSVSGLVGHDGTRHCNVFQEGRSVFTCPVTVSSRLGGPEDSDTGLESMSSSEAFISVGTATSQDPLFGNCSRCSEESTRALRADIDCKRNRFLFRFRSSMDWFYSINMPFQMYLTQMLFHFSLRPRPSPSTSKPCRNNWTIWNKKLISSKVTKWIYSNKTWWVLVTVISFRHSGSFRIRLVLHCLSWNSMGNVEVWQFIYV